MLRKIQFCLSIALLAFLPLNAQNIIKRIPEDSFGLSYADVFENMHYDQIYRPQVHYTPITGQIGDATGMVLYKGTYHLFHMYDEWSRSRKYNKNWGHAVSHDMVFWEQKPQILNTVLDNRPGSGSGLVDWNNTLGLQTGVEKTLVVFYTDYGRGICIAYSPDAGKTWIRHKDNPVIPLPEGRTRNAPRDALVFWYKPDQSWRMVLYDEPGFTFYKSENLLNWQFLSKVSGFFECPDFMEIPVDEDIQNKKWVIIDGNGTYRVGSFDGTGFKSDMANTKVDYGGDLYATQTWKHSYEGDGPFIQMAMIRFDGKQASQHDRTWNNQQCFPCELTLKNINGEIRLCRNPINGIKQLRYDPHISKDLTIQPGDNPLANIQGDVFEIIAEIDLDRAAGFFFDIRGAKMEYSVKDQTLNFLGNKAELKPVDNKIKLRLIVDRSSIEIFANQGEITFTNLFLPEQSNMNLELSSTGGSIRVPSMEVYRLRSIWLKREQELGYYRTASHK